MERATTSSQPKIDGGLGGRAILACMRNRSIFIVPLIVLLASPFCAVAEEQKIEDTVVKEQKGLRFNLPADWPIEVKNGVVGPIPIEEYLGRKFTALSGRIDALEERVGLLDKEVRIIEQELRRRTSAPPNAAPQTAAEQKE